MPSHHHLEPIQCMLRDTASYFYYQFFANSHQRLLFSLHHHMKFSPRCQFGTVLLTSSVYAFTITILFLLPLTMHNTWYRLSILTTIIQKQAFILCPASSPRLYLGQQIASFFLILWYSTNYLIYLTLICIQFEPLLHFDSLLWIYITHPTHNPLAYILQSHPSFITFLHSHFALTAIYLHCHPYKPHLTACSC